MKLTNKIIADLPIQDKEYERADDEITGLKIRVGKSGTKTFRLFYRNEDSKKKIYRIGKYGDIGLPAARASARKLKAEIALGNDPQTERVNKRKKKIKDANASLRAFLDKKYYPWAEKNQKAFFRTKQVMEFNFAHFMNKQMDSITPWDMDRWISGRKKEGTKPSTINRASTALVAVLNKAVEWQIINKNPISRRKLQKVDKRGVVRWLDDAEEKRLYKALDKRTGHLPVFVTLLLHTGARPKEALTLTWDSVDLEEKRVILHAAFTKTGQTRHIPLNATVHKVLSDWKKQAKTDWVFPNVKGDSHLVSLQKGWGQLLKEAKIANFRKYDMRHHFASKLVMNGVSIYEVAELLGHSSIEMSRIYAHLAPEHLQSAVDKIA